MPLDASVSAAGRVIFGLRQKSIEAYPRGKNARTNAFHVGHYEDFTESETAHEKSLGARPG